MWPELDSPSLDLRNVFEIPVDSSADPWKAWWNREKLQQSENDMWILLGLWMFMDVYGTSK